MPLTDTAPVDQLDKLDVLREWARRLRSGDYQQGREVLKTRHGDAYCCLGVLGEIYNERTGDEVPLVGVGYLDPEVWQRCVPDARGDTHSHDITDKRFQGTWSRYNDVDRYDFPQIADKVDDFIAQEAGQ